MLLRGLRRVVLCVLVAASSTAHADGTSVALEMLTWTELEDQVRAGRTTVIVPIGGTEQNGPHMALGKHNRRVALLAERIALALGNAVVAPVVAYVPEGTIDPPSAHMRYGGTISVPPETFVRVLEATAQSFRRHGFLDIVFLGDHGGYQKDIRQAAERLNRAWSALPSRAHALAQYYEAVESGYPELLRKRGYTDTEIGAHAGLADTSLMLALDPAFVRVQRMALVPERRGSDGVQGDPRRSSAEVGRLGVELIVARSVAAIRRSVTRP